MKFWFVRDKNTGLYFPEPRGREGRGGSHTEPDCPSDGDVRIFHSKLSASRFVSSWARGKVTAHRGGYTDFEGNHEYDEELEITPVSSRSKDNVEIIEKEIILE